MESAFRPAKKLNVLIIEDETAIREMMMATIDTTTGFQVVAQCSTVQEGLKAAESLKPEIVVLDWILENGTGRDFLNAIRLWKKRPLVLVFSGQISVLAVREAFTHGASGFIEKNCRLAEFIKALQNMAAGKVHLGPEIARLMKVQLAINGFEHVGSQISTRESEVLRLVANGSSSKEIAERLGISIRTVGSHRASLIKKTGMHSVAELTRHAFDLGLVTTPRTARG